MIKLLDPIKELNTIYKSKYYINLIKNYSNLEEMDKIYLNFNDNFNCDYKLADILLKYINNIDDILFVSFKKLENIKFYIEIEISVNRNQLIGFIFNYDMATSGKKKNYEFYVLEARKYNTNHIFLYIIQDNQINLDNIFIINDKIIKWHVSSFLLNCNSLFIWNFTRLDRMLDKYTDDTWDKHLLYKKYIDENLTLIEQNNLLLFSCSILFSIGATYCRDIDLLVYHKFYDKDRFIKKKIINLFYNNKKLDFIDFHMKGYNEWTTVGKKKYLDNWFLKDWHKLFGSNNLKQTVYNPKFYYYFFGLKLINFKADFIRRISRNRATSYADIITLDYYLGIQFNRFNYFYDNQNMSGIYYFDKNYWVNNEKKYYTDSDIENLILKTAKNLIRWHGLVLPLERIIYYFNFDDTILKNLNINKLKFILNKWIKINLLNNRKNIFIKNENEKYPKFLINYNNIN